MEDNKKGGYTADGKRLRPRRPRISQERNYTAASSHRVNFEDGGRKNYHHGGNRYDESRGNAFADNRSYTTADDNGWNGGERKPYHSSRRSQDGDRRSYNSRPGNGRRGQGGGRSFDNKGGRSYDNRKGGYSRKGGSYGYKKNAATEGMNRMLSRKPQLDSAQFSDNDTAPTPIKEEVRLNKFIANSGVCSRREADQMIQAGVVTVNGEVVTELGTKINVLKDDVRFNGERLKGEDKVYIVMNKPRGYVTTASDPHAEKTVMDLLKGCPYRVFPVGRLDKNTTGVLMFTNDGEIAERLTHPSYDKKKIYQVTLDSALSDEDFEKILSGIILGDGEVKADELEFIDEGDHSKLGIEIHSGKNRIVRRIFESLGYDVKALDRVYFAGLTKKGVKKGEWRYLTEGEANVLKMGAYL